MLLRRFLLATIKLKMEHWGFKMAIITCNENNIADGLRQAYEEGYRQGRIDEAKEWKNKVEQLRLEYESLKEDLQLYYMTKVF